MYLTQHTDYALRILIYLGTHTERYTTIAEISEHFSISRTHLMKVANQLVRAGFIEGIRGKGGGLQLKRPPESINIGEVVRYTEREMALAECFKEKNNCLLTKQCRFKGVLYGALQAFMRELEAVSLADLLDSPAQAQCSSINTYAKCGGHTFS